MKVTVGISARHIHLSEQDVNLLFGEGYKLTHFKDLSQPGQYACEEKVTIVNEANGKEIAGVRILGPTRPVTQVEVSRSDAIKLKMFNIPVKSSGDLEGTPAIKLVGPKGEVTLEKGIMVADRHIHMHTSDAAKFGVNDMDIVSVKVEGLKGGIMSNVLCRVKESFALDMHIDTDDACAFGLANGQEVEIVK